MASAGTATINVEADMTRLRSLVAADEMYSLLAEFKDSRDVMSAAWMHRMEAVVRFVQEGPQEFGSDSGSPTERKSAEDGSQE